jgi:DNA helicase-2/ATP-dependent DNA helicase PcrA
MADLMQDRTVEGISRQENVQELMDGMHDFVRSRQEEGEESIGLPDFLSDVALLTDQDNEEDDGTPKVTLMTVHAAKGLEFDTVFVVGMEEQLFPSMMAYDSTRQMEEERRLLYVAITRAEKRCLLSYAKSRFRYGKVEYGMPSRFLKDIDRGYIEAPVSNAPAWGSQSLWGSQGQATRRIQPSQTPWNNRASQSTSSWGSRTQDSQSRQSEPRSTSTSSVNISSAPKRTVISTRTESSSQTPASTHRRLVSPNAVQGAAQVAKLTPGQFIEHERFGVGEVIRVEGTGENTKALIRFKNAGEKQLLLKFARFRVLG